ncbi:MAG: hypothetical protein H7062_08540 [Candidatus Saccharimonas sp.]|nr:hypothetical protein [Planctomycetaceae bacterium]
MDDYLSIDEIESQFAPDWVLIADPKTDELQQLLGGRVVERSTSRSELYRKAKELGLHHIAVLKLGPLRTDLVYML